MKKHQTYWVQVKARPHGAAAPVLAPTLTENQTWGDDTTLEEMVRDMPNIEDDGDAWEHTVQP